MLHGWLKLEALQNTCKSQACTKLSLQPAYRLCFSCQQIEPTVHPCKPTFGLSCSSPLSLQQLHSVHSSQAHAQLRLQLVLRVPVCRSNCNCLSQVIHLCCFCFGHLAQLLGKLEGLWQGFWQDEIHCHLHTAGQITHLCIHKEMSAARLTWTLLPSCQTQCAGGDSDRERAAAMVQTATHVHPCGVLCFGALEHLSEVLKML